MELEEITIIFLFHCFPPPFPTFCFALLNLSPKEDENEASKSIYKWLWAIYQILLWALNFSHEIQLSFSPHTRSPSLTATARKKMNELSKFLMPFEGNKYARKIWWNSANKLCFQAHTKIQKLSRVWKSQWNNVVDLIETSFKYSFGLSEPRVNSCFYHLLTGLTLTMDESSWNLD